MRIKSVLVACLIASVLILTFSGQLFAEAVQAKDDASSDAYPKVFGNRIPKDYFVTAGKGDTDIGPGDDPWETGSYDLALMDARIANFNVMEYTSVLPPEAREIPIAEAEKWFHHGAVIEVIMASVNGVKGNTLCTGVGRIQVRRRSDGKHIGGFAAEYEKVHQDKIAAEEAKRTADEMLSISLMGEFNRRYNSNEYEFFDERHEVNSFKVEKKYGTSLVALCWVSYIYPRRSTE